MASSSQHHARPTKKQKKATAFRERGNSKSKGKGKGKGKPNPAPGRLRPFTTTGEDGDDDDDANAIPALEDQDQALAEMARDAEGDPKGHEEGRVPKTAVAAAQDKGKNGNKKRGRGSRADDDDGRARPRAKRARFARSAEGILPPAARDEDGAPSVNDGDGADGSKANNKTLRYILFIGNVLQPSPPLPPTTDRACAHQRKPQVHHDARSNSEPLLPMRCVPFPPFHTFNDTQAA
jgi:nucleolar protein 6